MRRLSDLPFYPLLIAGYFPLYMMAANWATFDLGDVVPPLLACILAALVGVVVVAAVLRNVHRAALWIALLLIPVLYIRLVQEVVNGLGEPWIGRLSGTHVLAGLVLTLVPIALLSGPGRNFTRIANVAAAVMIAFPAVSLLQKAVATNAIEAVARSDAERQRRALFADARADATKPNIVHIVLDGYSRQDVLNDLYGFDNSAFLDALRGKGFAVADRATTPYGQTLLAMSSILSADYLSGIDERARSEDLDGLAYKRFLRERLQYNPVMETLSGLGYQLAATGGTYDPVRLRRVDRFLSPLPLSNFASSVFAETVFYPIFLAAGGVLGDGTREIFTTPLERDLKSPFFLYAHAIAPHPPFNVDRHGNPIRPRGGEWRNLNDGADFTQGKIERQRMYIRGYLDKLMFVNTQILSYVDRIIADVPDPKVIIIHSDHGGGLHIDHDRAEASCLKERYSPLLAVFSSDGRLQEALPPDANLVNLYRLVFNTYFAADLPPLPGRTFFATWDRPEIKEPLSPARIERTCAMGKEALTADAARWREEE